MKLSSSIFQNNGTIPTQYTCVGEGRRPALTISGVPTIAKSLAIILHDPDAPNGHFVHWTIWNINPATTEIVEISHPVGCVQGKTSIGKPGFVAPCPPSGTHRYIFTLYALDTVLNLSEGATEQELLQEIDKHLVEKTELIGMFGK